MRTPASAAIECRHIPHQVRRSNCHFQQNIPDLPVTEESWDDISDLSLQKRDWLLIRAVSLARNMFHSRRGTAGAIPSHRLQDKLFHSLADCRGRRGRRSLAVGRRAAFGKHRTGPPNAAHRRPAPGRTDCPVENTVLHCPASQTIPI